MNLNAVSPSVETFKLHIEFQRLRETLLQEEFADRLHRPLAYWALPSDRRLPLAFLGHALRDLLQTPFDELSATPGIGQKKIGTLVDLLARAAKKEPLASPGATEKVSNHIPSQNGHSFDPSAVSEALWEKWRDTVRRHDVGHEKLGRLAASLQSLPTVIWHTRLSEYANYTVAEIRNLKTHGEKRIRNILEVFHAVHQILADVPTQASLTVRPMPRFVVVLERNINDLIDGGKVPARGELRDRVVQPLVEQLRIDAGAAIAKLTEGRLGLGGRPQPVRRQSRRMGVTRARVYQLLETCAMIMAVRWPEGAGRLRALEAFFNAQSAPADRLELLRSTIELLYPDADTPNAGDNSRGLAAHR